jgi:S1-C subfamily serine protease
MVRLAVLILALSLPGCGFLRNLPKPAPAAAQEEQGPNLVQMVLDNTLALATKDEETGVYENFCSGVAVDGTFLTADHCIADEETFHVLYRGEYHPGLVVVRWQERDLAVIEAIGAKAKGTLEVSPWEPEYGMMTVWAGYPLGEPTLRVFTGIVAAPVNVTYEHWFDVDGQFIPGNSGGPIVDEKGRVIGILSASAIISIIMPQLIDIGHGVRPEYIRQILNP